MAMIDELCPLLYPGLNYDGGYHIVFAIVCLDIEQNYKVPFLKRKGYLHFCRTQI